MPSAGIKRVPIIRNLGIDFVHGFPYDSMHQIFLGWTKQLLSLCIGNHKHYAKVKCSFIIHPYRLEEISHTLCRSSTGIASSWGRPPRSLTHLSCFKAEEFKNMALFYGPYLFSDGFVRNYITSIWSMTSEICHTVSDPTPSTSDYASLNVLGT